VSISSSPSPSRLSVLSPERRRADLLAAQNEQFDVVIIGGGVTGVGAALDAASRGLKVCLVEKRDFAAGTSSRSSKLVHGGLRYLEQRDFGLVREALGERRVLLETVAPHLVRPASFLLPLRKHYERPYIGAGVLLYDILAGRNSAVPHHRHLSHRQCLEAVPSLNPESLVGGISYYDAQIDDSRHTTVVARTAAAFGAACLSGVAVRRVLTSGGRACGVEVVDTESGSDASFEIRAHTVLNATGVWSTAIEESAGVRNPLRVRASKGIHIVIPRARIKSSTAMIIRTAKSVLFLLPWGDRWVIGTTDTDWNYDLDHPSASSTDIDYVLHWANTVLSEKLTRDDVVGVYSGLRPLIAGGASATTKLSREHAVNVAMPGLVSIAGGKYTTYRLMAIDAIDAIGRELGRSIPKSDTESIPLLGAEGLDGLVGRLRSHPAANPLHDDVIAHLAARYGSTATELLDLIAQDPALARALPGFDRSADGSSDSLNDPREFDTAHRSFSNGGRYLAVEVLHSVLYEGALRVDDVLCRRTRASIESDDRAVAAARPTAEIMAGPLGWSSSRINQETDHYVQRVDAERRAELAPDDTTSALARSAVRDARLQVV
jgi:glycerol-3-phosphate dehydrogenase